MLQEVSEYGFVYGSNRWKSQFSVDSQLLRTQPTKQPPQSSSKGNLFVRVRFGGVPSTVEEVVRVRLCCSVAYLIERPTRETRAEQYSDTVLMLGRQEWCMIWGKTWQHHPPQKHDQPADLVRSQCWIALARFLVLWGNNDDCAACCGSVSVSRRFKFSDGHKTRLPLGKGRRRTSKKFCAFLEGPFLPCFTVFLGQENFQEVLL